MPQLVLLLITICPLISYAEWTEYKPIRPTSDKAYLADIHSHLSSGDFGIYHDSDLITSGHECTHGINSKIRQNYPGCNALYVKGNWAYVIKEPPVRLSTVTSQIREKGNIFQLYMITSGSNWDNQPLYILDEKVAYTNGAVVGIERKNQNRGAYSFENALEMTTYAIVLQKLANNNKSYDATDLNNYMSFHLRRCHYIYIEMDKLGWITPKHKYWAELIKANRLRKKP